MFERIIVPLDGSRFAEVALAPARELARAFGSRILLVRAVPPHGLPSVLTDMMGLTPGDGDGFQSEVERANDADAYLHSVTEHLRQSGYDADMALALAAPGTGIAQAAALSHADLIVMAAHLRWKVPASSGTSATLDVLVRSRVPLLAWRVGGIDEEEPEGGPDVAERPPLLARTELPLVVALDGTPLAETALPVAEALARVLGLYIVLVRAVEQPKQEAEALQYLLRIQAGLDQRGVPAVSKTATGDPLSVIESAWRESAGGLIVMTSRGRLGPHGTFFGSLAARMLEEVEAPALVLRPQEGADVVVDAGVR